MRLRPAEIDLKSAKLTPEEGYVLSRLDGPVEADQIAAITGLPEAKVDEIVTRLIQAGMLVVEGNQSPSMIPSVPPGARSSAPPEGDLADVMIPSAAALPDIGPGGLPAGSSSLDEWAAGLPPGIAPLGDSEPPPSSELPPGVTPIGSDAPPGFESLPAGITSLSPSDLPTPDDLLPGAAEFAGPPVAPRAPPVPTRSALRERAMTAPEAPRARAAAARAPDVLGAESIPEGVLPSLEGERFLPPGVPDIFDYDDDPKAEAAPPAGAAASDSVAAPSSSRLDSSAPPRDPGHASRETDARRLYGERFRDLDSGTRLRHAAAAEDPDLSALCFDPEPQVIAALLGNRAFGVTHARLLALHHHTAAGIDLLVRHGELFRDPQVQKNLLKNPQIPEPVLQRAANGKRLLDLYRSCIDRDLPENVRVKLRGELRKRFATGSAEEKAELVMRSEGRVLHLLAGCTFDGKTTQILCGRTFSSAVIVQNLAKFTASPPALLAKVVQQPFVSRQPGLKNLLLRHPNMPGEIKRKL